MTRSNAKRASHLVLVINREGRARKGSAFFFATLVHSGSGDLLARMRLLGDVHGPRRPRPRHGHWPLYRESGPCVLSARAVRATCCLAQERIVRMSRWGPKSDFRKDKQRPTARLADKEVATTTDRSSPPSTSWSKRSALRHLHIARPQRRRRSDSVTTCSEGLSTRRSAGLTFA